ncbi:hypothetical protein BJF97_09955 [Klebsiella sp. LTGPAF-6F]|nr:hypothetical protein BJF97_09955 [Klebsiella sp. LTGPAF-6F]
MVRAEKVVLHHRFMGRMEGLARSEILLLHPEEKPDCQQARLTLHFNQWQTLTQTALPDGISLVFLGQEQSQGLLYQPNTQSVQGEPIVSLELEQPCRP